MPPTKRLARRVIPRVTDDEETTTEETAFEEGANETEPAPAAKSAKARMKGEPPPIRGGWGEGQKQMESTSTFAQSLKPEEKIQVIKFLEPQPYANFRRHWIERVSQEGKTNRPYTCPRTFDKECPLCDIGDKPQAVSAFNVAVLGDEGQLFLKSWDCGVRLFQTIKGYANDPKTAPLTKGFYLVNKTGKKGSTNTNVSPVSARSLEEDYEMDVPDQTEFDAMEKYTVDIIEVQPMKFLRELASELDEEYNEP